MAYENLRKGRVSIPHQIYFLTTVTSDRIPYFTDLFIGRRVVNEMRILHESHAVTSLAWVLMPDHLHWLFELGEKYELGKVVKLLKGRSARTINRVLGKKGAFWQREYYEHALRRDEDIQETARYIIANPLRAGLVEQLGDYPLWDAIWF
ncbi:MAG: REP-associated tyrosine transposase [Gammaproteobacteria bacterium]